ncbi:uncharacterized protein FA14DRAFT_189874 [Meira miltonrushii]|uniref:Uncharacterized protein n=1 Tax=Meira miltonrushii TaxID=1280837 RepID=A0A316VFV0_9BASI|nr:uncharacterized protein FA14DRAFT_189874 [Meira miltonrushii]PWN35948.1 hypothetical protein FA14DRAFT_189874 [Meira miltonrushii]
MLLSPQKRIPLSLSKSEYLPCEESINFNKALIQVCALITSPSYSSPLNKPTKAKLCAMFQLLTPTIVSMLLCSTALASGPLATGGGIHLISNFSPPPSGGADKVHTIIMLGDFSDYNIIPDADAKHVRSSATCREIKVKHKAFASSPCATSVKDHDQLFTITCNHANDTHADIQFLQSGEITISATGKVYGGFSNESKHLHRIGGPDKPLKAKGDDIGVIINCRDNKRSSP